MTRADVASADPGHGTEQALSADPNRWLETAEAAERFSSHHQHYLHHVRSHYYPDWIAWITVALFCSSYIIVPVVMVAVFGSTLLCYRGSDAIGFVEQCIRYLGLSHYLPSNTVALGKQMVDCGTDGSGVVCRLCATLNPGALSVVLGGCLIVGTVYPNQRWPAFQRCFRYWFRIFNFRFKVESRPFSEGRTPYMFVVMPHGVVPLACLIGTSYAELFVPRVKLVPAAASVLFRIPILRQVFSWLGAVKADRENLRHILQDRQENICIIPGGIAEIFLSNRRREQIYLRKRRGFIRLAQETGATVVPVYIFGHTRLFDQLAGADGWAASFSRLIKGSLTLFWGQCYLPIPYQTDLTVAFGRMVPPAASTGEPDGEKLAQDDLQARFISAVEDLYAENQEEAGYGGVPLDIL